MKFWWLWFATALIIGLTTMSSSPSEPERNVLIVGAGDIGLGVAAEMATSDEWGTIYTLNRSGRRPEKDDPSIVSVTADITDAAALAAQVENIKPIHVLIFTTAPPGRTEEAYRAAYVTGVDNVLDALEERHHVGRIVLMSSTGAYGNDDASFVDETTDALPSRATARVLVEGEKALHARRPDACILRPGGIYGLGRSLFLAKMVARGDRSVARDGTPRFSNRIHRIDLISATVLVASHPSPPPIVVVVDGPAVPSDEITAWMAEALPGDIPAPPEQDVDAPSGKRCSPDLLLSLGWTPQYPSYKEGYGEIFATLTPSDILSWQQ